MLDFNAGLHSRSPPIVINMDVRLPSLSTSIPLNGFAICNSLGRRVSLLNDDEPISLPPYIQPSSPQHYPLSPAYSSDSERSDHNVDHLSYDNPSPPSTSPLIPDVSPSLPPLDLISFNIPNYDPLEPISRKTSFSSVSGYSRRGSLVSANGRMTSSQSNQSRGGKRRYECATCRKTFTTSGHVARHNRIHTGEKNFQCPEPGCLQRFSRQDNCMYGPAYLTADWHFYRQHYRTHKNHTSIRPEGPHSPRTTPPLNSHRNKKRRADGRKRSEESIDPNDRLNAFATYISVYS